MHRRFLKQITIYYLVVMENEYLNDNERYQNDEKNIPLFLEQSLKAVIKNLRDEGKDEIRICLVIGRVHTGSSCRLREAEAIERGIKKVTGDVDIIKIPVADGGEGGERIPDDNDRKAA